MMHVQYTPYILPLLASAVGTAALGIYAWRHRAVPGAVPFTVLTLAIVIWSLAYALQLASVDLPAKCFWNQVQYPGNVAMPVAWLALALQYTGRDRWLSHRRLAALAIVPLLTIALLLTNDLHHLVWRDVTLDTAGPFVLLRKTYGPWFWVHAAYAYALLLLTALMLVEALRRAPPLYHGQPLALLLGLFLMVLGNASHVSGIDASLRFDPTPFLFIPAGGAMAWGLFRFGLFDVVPVARNRVVEGMDDGVIVVDAHGRVVDLNPAAQRILGYLAFQAAGREAARAFGGWLDLVALCHDETATQAESVWGAGDAQRHYDLRCVLMTDRRGRLIGRLIVLRDITGRKRAQAQLLQQQRALAVLEERARLAQELHDSLGQVLGYVNVQAQAAREWLCSGQIEEAEADLARLVAVTQSFHADVREYILSLGATLSPEQGFLPALEQYLERFGRRCGIHTELIVQDGPADGQLELAVEAQLLRIIYEALANVRKHAGASSVRVEIAVHDGLAQIAVEDDGRGFDPGQSLNSERRGLGLHIIRERTEGVGGSLQVRSTPGRGTRVVVEVPVRGN
jgi:PAS domain S-box-containing protein